MIETDTAEDGLGRVLPAVVTSRPFVRDDELFLTGEAGCRANPRFPCRPNEQAEADEK
jgi:hypothetical protein